MRTSLAAAALAAVLAAAAAGCEGEPPRTALGYTEDAKRAYDAAMKEFDAHNWIEAQTMMREVKRKYSYSKWARQAELRIADADYAQEKYSDAIREYKDFSRAHRSDKEDVAYAQARIAEAMYAEIPESALLPASEERDQATVVEAYGELKGYLADYSDQKEAPHIRELLAMVTGRLVRHELYVARFYLNKDNYDAAVARIQYALRTYATHGQAGLAPAPVSQGYDLEAEALLVLGETYLKMHKWPEAKQSFEAITHSYAQSPIAIQAQNYLSYLQSRGV
jgi:outer membrane protein assembly factor BamD